MFSQGETHFRLPFVAVLVYDPHLFYVKVVVESLHYDHGVPQFVQ